MFRTLDSAYVAQPASLNTCVDAFVCAFARGAVARSRSGRCPLPSRGEERERERRETLRRLSSPSSSSFFLSFFSSRWIMLKVSTRMIHASVRAYLSPRGLSASVRSALFANRGAVFRRVARPRSVVCTLCVHDRVIYVTATARIYPPRWKSIFDSWKGQGWFLRLVSLF